MPKNIDDWVKIMESDLDQTAYRWAEELGKALNGATTGELDAVIEQLKSNSIFPETTPENAAEQIARLVKWRVKLLKFGMLTQQLLMAVQAITQGLESTTLHIADEKYAEYIELDYLPSNPESMAGDRFKPETGRDYEDRDDESSGRRPRT